MKRLEDLSLKGKRVLLRVDFNVPLTKGGQVEDNFRIQATLPTIRYLLENQVKQIFLLSHLGKPKGRDLAYSLAPCAKELSSLLGENVVLAEDCIGPQVEKLQDRIVMLENLRFHVGEEAPEKEAAFVSSLARLGDVYVNDAFATAHRKHASTAVLAEFFPKNKGAGFLLEKEVLELSSLFSPKRPFYALLGGAKISSKIGVIEALLKKVDRIYIGGALCFPFLQAKQIALGASKVSASEEAIAKKLLENTDKIELPLDLIAGARFENATEHQTVAFDLGILPSWFGMDVGPKTVNAWSLAFQEAKTVFWNGPLGVFEFPVFAKGTLDIGKALAESSAKVIVGGGDSIAAIQKLGLENCFAYLSTGGGASLEFLEKEGHLPGIDALDDHR